MYITTEAFIGPDSQINLASGADASQSVNVTRGRLLQVADDRRRHRRRLRRRRGRRRRRRRRHERAGPHRPGLDRAREEDVEVYGLSRKEVQTYALSAAGGFVGVAIAVSVWSVGTQANSNYQDTGGAGPDKGTWAANVEYHAGDVVTDSFDNKRYMARCDVTPNENWRTSTTTATRDYNECRVVKDPFDGKLYQAKRPTSGGSQPHAQRRLGALHADWRRTPTRTATKPCEDDNTQICSSATWSAPTDALDSPSSKDSAHDDQSAKKSIGSADMTASGDSDNGGGAPPAWAPGPYTAGAYVSFNGHV